MTDHSRALKPVVYAIQPTDCYNHCLTKLSGATGFFFNIYNEGSETICSCASPDATASEFTLEGVVRAACVAADLDLHTYVKKGAKKVKTVKHGETIQVVFDVINPL